MCYICDMARKKKKKRTVSTEPKIPPLSPERWERYYLALEQAENDAHQGNITYWDLGPGERPRVVLVHFRQVARKEQIPVTIEIAKSQSTPSLKFTFQSKSSTPKVRVVDSAGTVKAELEKD